MNCTVCGNQRDKLRTVHSKAAPGMQFYACNDCRNNGFEPRYLLVLAAKSGLEGRWREYIRNHLYIGRTIQGSEVV